MKLHFPASLVGMHGRMTKFQPAGHGQSDVQPFHTYPQKPYTLSSTFFISHLDEDDPAKDSEALGMAEPQDGRNLGPRVNIFD